MTITNRQNLAAVLAIAAQGRKSIEELQAERSAYAAERARRMDDRYARGAEDDSFVSERCEALHANQIDVALELAQCGNVTVVEALYHGDSPVEAGLVEGRFGRSWDVSKRDVEAFGLPGRFIPDTRSGRGAVTKAGLKVRYEVRPAREGLSGGGTGFAGLYSTRAVVQEDTEGTRRCRQAGIGFPVIDAASPAEAEAVLIGIVAPEVARGEVEGTEARVGLRELHESLVATGGSDDWGPKMIAAYERGIALSKEAVG